MAAVRGKNTQPELVIRKALHGRGFRYRIHVSELPGSPDVVFPRYRGVLLVHGCFWHGHDCPLFRLPRTRSAFWAAKIRRNRERDLDVLEALGVAGWRCLTLWECALRGRGRWQLPALLDEIELWLRGTDARQDIRGKNPSATNPTAQ